MSFLGIGVAAQKAIAALIIPLYNCGEQKASQHVQNIHLRGGCAKTADDQTTPDRQEQEFEVILGKESPKMGN